MPSYLYYNPLDKESKVLVKNETGDKIDLYNTVAGKFIAKNVSGETTFTLKPREAAVLVFVPSGSKITYDKNKMLGNSVVIDYQIKLQ